MSHFRGLAVLLLLPAMATALRAQPPSLPDEKEPLLRLEAGGPTSDVTALALSPDGQTLYAAGWDKVVRVWKRDAVSGEFVPQRTSYRVPLGPGLHGAINALALSADGQWLAVGGLGVFRGQSGFRLPGVVVPAAAMTPEMRADEGTIYVFSTARPGQARELRGHHGPVLALAFVQQPPRQAPLLVSAGRDWEEPAQHYTGAVRLWDLTTGTSRADRSDLPDPENRFPGLAAWRAGPARDQIRVALAWDDGTYFKAGKLRFWDIERKQLTDARVQEGRFNNTVAFLPQQGNLITGSWTREDGNGWLQTWDAATGATAPGGNASIAFLRENQTVFFPRALALVAAKGDGKLDHAAVVLRVVPDEEYRLLLIPLGAPGPFRVADAIPLWKGRRVPVITASPRGDHLALAGAPDNTIRVYAIADLLRGRARPQVLRSIGAHIGYAAFVSKGQGKARQVGLVLSEQAKVPPGSEPQAPQAGDMVLDFTTRLLAASTTGWNLDGPALAGWTHTQVGAEAGGAAPPHLAMRSPDGVVRLIKLSDGRTITDHALLPPRPPLNLPVLAVASEKGKEPALSLYNAATGDLLCQFTGHQSAISSLAFSGDGRFLVSAAADQTVCLWSLVKLEAFVGKKGQLRGVVVQEGPGNKLRVASVATDSPARALLKVNDIIDGLVNGGKLRPLTSPLEFYDTLLSQVPGKEATLRLAGGRDVKVPVSQAAQERTPLLVLFVTQRDKGNGREWLAWNPVGPYDSSTPRMARAFGWHFNSGNPREPVQFTPADEDRAQERREGLLKHLLARGSLADALEDFDKEKKAKPLPPPEMTLGIDDMDRQLVHQPRSTLRLRIEAIPVDRLASVQWQIDNQPWQPFAETGGADYAQPIELQRGRHQVQVRLRTREEVPQEFTRQLAVTYQPLPPVVEPRGAAAEATTNQALKVEREAFSLEAAVQPGVPGEKVLVQLYHQHQPVDPSPSSDGKIARTIKLRPGNNRIEVIAVNQGARPGAEGPETGRLVLNVNYIPPRPPEVVPPPLIALEAIVPLLGGTEPGPPQPIQPGQPVIVMGRFVRLVGSIKAEKALALAQRVDADGRSVDLAKFTPGAARVHAIDEALTLLPGSQKITVRARTATSKVAQQVVVILYRPSLPRPELAATPAGPAFYDEGQGPPEVRLSGRLVPPRDPAPAGVKLTAALLHNGKEIPAALGPGEQTWSAQVRLEPGYNRFQLKVGNDWQQAVSGDLQLNYLRPPHNLRATVPPSSSQKTLELIAQVDSLLPLTPKSVRATVNRRAVTDVQVTDPAAPGKAWLVRLKLQLEPGRNDILLEVANAEGLSREPATWMVTYQPPKPPPEPPQVVLLQPQATSAPSDMGLKVSRPDLRVQFRVQSPAPLKRIALMVRREGRQAEHKVFDAAGASEFTAGTDLRLAPGMTTLVIEAENAGGTGASPALLVNYVLPPARLVLESLETQEEKQQTYAVTAKPDGKLVCDPVPSARVRLHGQVAWEQPDPQLAGPRVVGVYVNGSLQWRGELAPASAGTLVRAFKADLLLNRASANQIEVDVAGLKLPDSAVRALTVDCRHPQGDQWLHVQIISPDEPNESRLIAQVLQTLQASNYLPQKAEFTRSGFARARLYRPLTEDVDEDMVTFRLLTIKRQIAQRNRDGWPNDVVLVYYVGGEEVDNSGRFISLTQGTPPQPLITRQRLEKEFADMLGVKVLLLDVSRQRAGAGIKVEATRNEVSRWLNPPDRFAWMRAAWTDKGNMPADARLLTALQDALPGSQHLADVARGLDRHFRLLSERYGALRADWYLPPPLGGLVVSSAPPRK
jgi:WD40 repeat protein